MNRGHWQEVVRVLATVMELHSFANLFPEDCLFVDDQTRSFP